MSGVTRWGAGLALVGAAVGASVWADPPAAKLADSKTADAKPVVRVIEFTDPNTKTVYEDFGLPLPLTVAGHNPRKLHLHRGRGAEDKADENANNRLIYYHEWLPALVERTTAGEAPGYPPIVWKAEPDNGLVALTIRVRLSGDNLRRACAAFLRHHHDGEFQKFAADPAKAPQVVVKPLPASLCWFALADGNSPEQLLAECKPFLKEAGDTHDLVFKLPPDGVPKLLDLYDRGRLVLHYAPVARGMSVKYAYHSVKLDLQARNQIKKALDQSNLPPGSRLAAADGTVYLTQNAYDQVKFQVTARFQKQIVADAPELAQLVVQDPALLGDLFQTTAISVGELAKLPGFNEQALSEYFVPLVKQTVSSLGREDVTVVGKTTETGSRAGAGFAAFLPSIAVGAGGELSRRDIETVQRATGVRYTKVEGEQRYVPADIRVYKVLAAELERDIGTSTLVAIGTGAVTGYQQSMPLPQAWTEAALDKALEVERSKCQGFPSARQPDVLLTLAAHEKLLSGHGNRLTQTEQDLVDKVKDLAGRIDGASQQKVQFRKVSVSAVGNNVDSAWHTVGFGAPVAEAVSLVGGVRYFDYDRGRANADVWFDTAEQVVEGNTVKTKLRYKSGSGYAQNGCDIIVIARLK